MGAAACFAYLGEKLRPDGLDIDNLGGLDQGLELVGLCNQRISIPAICSSWPLPRRPPPVYIESRLMARVEKPFCEQQYQSLYCGGRGGRGREGGSISHSDINAIVGEDKGRVGRSELGSRHLFLILRVVSLGDEVVTG